MRKTALFIGFFVLLTPSLAWAQTTSPSCSAKGYTVVFVNGIFDTKEQADADKLALRKNLGFEYNNEPITVQLGYNPTHLAGAGDFLQSTAQLFSTSISNFDLNTILLEIYPEVQTRKLVLVGHSQGAFYTNDMYNYLLAHGEPKDAVNVYNVASPATYTAGSGTYLNSSGDTLLAYLRIANKSVLPNNIDLYAADPAAFFSGHNFVINYLGEAGDRIKSDIDGEMSMLGADDATDHGDCFTPPQQDTTYTAQQIGFALADPIFKGTVQSVVAIGNTAFVIGKSAEQIALGSLQFFNDTVTITTNPPTEQKQTQTTEKIIDKLYGSSVENLSPQDKKDLLGANQASAVALSNPPKAQTVDGIVLGTSTEATTTAVIATITTAATSTSAFPPVDPNFFNWLPGGGSGGLPVAAAADDTSVADSTPQTANTDVPAQTDTIDLDNPDMVINEIEWAGDMFDGGREWIELKNRTSSDIDLSNYALYAKEGGDQYIPLAGTLSANGLFVVERDSRAPLTGGAVQVYQFDQLDDTGEQLALARVSDTGTTTIDMTPSVSTCSGWCAGSTVSDANQGETLSMERISADKVGTDSASWASNDTYTVTANMPTPAGQPWLANGLPLYATPLVENSLHQPETGFYCNPDKYSITSGQQYAPQTGQCVVLDKDISFPGPFSAGVFKGTVGSSTEVGFTPGLFHSGKMVNILVDFSDTEPGDQYFVAIWQPYANNSLIGGGACTDPRDDTRIPSYLETGHWLGRDSWCGDFTVDRTDIPDTQYVLIPFTYGQ